MSDYKILLFYKYTDLNNPELERKIQWEMGKELGLTGRIILSTEGINGTLEGFQEEVQKYQEYINSKPEFQNIHWKISNGDGKSFPKWSVKVREELVTTKILKEVDPRTTTGKYLEPEELHQWFLDKKEFYIVDMRNDYEHEVGHFEGSILTNMTNFKELPHVLEQIKHLKNKTILTCCTGGIRCQKASGFLLLNGFTDVYQLSGGIVSYMQKYPNQNFLGKLYVFDNRVIIGFNADAKEHKTIGKCRICKQKSENYIDGRFDGKRVHTIVCKECSNLYKEKYEIEDW